MGAIQLTERERKIERILHMPDEQIVQLAELIEILDNDPNWGDEGISAAELERRNRIDQAVIEATRGEPTRPLEDVLRKKAWPGWMQSCAGVLDRNCAAWPITHVVWTR